MNGIQTFSNPMFGTLRTAEINGKIYYCGNDVANALGYTKPRNAITQHCRYALKWGIPHPQNPMKEIQMSFIPEGDVYRLAARSKLPQAQDFESWVFDEVLPQINHTGGYQLPNKPIDILKLIVQANEQLSDRIDKVEERVNEFCTYQPQQIESKDNSCLSAEHWGKIKQHVIDKVHDITDEVSKQRGLYRTIYRDIHKLTNVKKCKEILDKDYKRVLAFVDTWNG